MATGSNLIIPLLMASRRTMGTGHLVLPWYSDFSESSDSPTNAVISFKADANLLAGQLASGTSNMSIGLAIDSELNSLASWTSYISTASPNRSRLALVD